MLGISNLQKVVIAVVKIANKTDETLQDGFQPFQDLFSIVSASAGDVFTALKSAKEAYNEYLDLDPMERQQVLDAVREEFDLEDDTLEGIVEDGFELIEMSAAFALKVRNALK
jgi:acyl-CoA reductase-like NAD-dependent aldehyde dehydrogenase